MLFQVSEQNTATGTAENVDLAASADGTGPILLDEGPALSEIKPLRAVSLDGFLVLQAPFPSRSGKKASISESLNAAGRQNASSTSHMRRAVVGFESNFKVVGRV